MKTKNYFKTLWLSIVCSLVSNILMAAVPDITVSGIVTDASTGHPLAGVSITIDGTHKATVSSQEGKYSITTKVNTYLRFSAIGFKTQKVRVKKTVLNIRLTPDNAVLKEEAVTEYVSHDEVARPMAKMVCRAALPAPYQTSYRPALNEEYSSFSENRFLSPDKNPLSTFSIDVDAASYANMRRFINQGQLPLKDAVRVEELVNYFSYNYSLPSGNHPVNIDTEVGICPWNKEHRLVKIGLKAKEIPSENLPEANFVFLIDVSGSMYGPTRLELIKSSLKLLVNNLREKDRVAIVVYSGSAGEVLPSTSGNEKQKIKDAIEKLTAGGSTAGGEGINLAYKIASQNFIKGGNNRIILCTDGDFNVGISDDKALETLISSKRKSGIYLTILGYGMGNYKDKKMQVLAEKGNGNHAYIDNLQEANKVLVNEFGSSLYTVANDVKLQIEFNPAQVQSYRLIGYESRMLNDEDFNDDTKDAGEIGAGHTVTAFYEVIPVGVKGNIPGTIDALKYQSNTSLNTPQLLSSKEMLTVKLRYKMPDEKQSRRIEKSLIDKGGDNVSDDFRFASAVAMFGQLLRDSDFKGNASFEKVVETARKGLGDDREGYRHEFIRLAETAGNLSK